MWRPGDRRKRRLQIRWINGDAEEEKKCGDRRLKRFMEKCTDILLATVPSAIRAHNSYSVSWKNRFDSDREEIRLLRARKLSDQMGPMETLLYNFCHSVDDARHLQKNPEKLWVLKLAPPEVENMLQEVMFLFEKQRRLEAAAEQVERRKKKQKRTEREVAGFREHF